MITQILIRDIVLIEKLDINFERGLSVLTGETGAGKSILLDSLSLALGARGDASLVRSGVSQGQVTAIFDIALNHPTRQLLQDSGFKYEGNLVLRRIQSADGRSRVFINDQVANVGLMRNVGRLLVEIHGQHADRALVDTGIHRAFLDAFGGFEMEIEELEVLYNNWKDRERELSRHRSAVEEITLKANYLRSSVEELGCLDPQNGEEEILAERRTHMIKSEKIAGNINEASEILSGFHSPVPILANLVRRLERKIPEAKTLVEPIVIAIDQALDALKEAQDGIDLAIRTMNFDPHELETTEERLFSLRAAARKYAVTVENLPQLREKMEKNLSELNAEEIALKQMEGDVKIARTLYDTVASNLSARRTKAARHLEKMVMKELSALKLDQAEFIVKITVNNEQRSAHGIDTVEYWVRTNPGMRIGPMIKVASGGELSRFLLALKVALADGGSAPTLIFDEIDTGVGGAVADSIGQSLKCLSKRVQVLAVTHAPQVAARADAHFLIAKAETGREGRIATRIHLMESHGRQEEIARMLSGAYITDEARAAARKLLRGER
ncbi:MAG: DNA repair protein RecN (Recombination protein N) [Candidatus Tokpelaia sp. JSC188]|nr:MAG: DNA repair protein RecN (Recombination protein N) [Candidatus Tokpelaia sp. JSC188]